MSVAEELHKTIDALTEDQHQALLETARRFLRIKRTPILTKQAITSTANSLVWSLSLLRNLLPLRG